MAGGRRSNLSDGQRKLKAFLKAKERGQQTFSIEDIISATGWKPITVTTYLNKGYLSAHVSKVDENSYTVTGVLGLSDSAFLSSITQTQTIREVGAFCTSKLARGLVQKSRENMILALELFNRPTIGSRVDGFVIMSSVAWEQLLKAALIEKNGESTIFRPTRPNRPRETISLRVCLERSFEQNNPIRKNLERVQFLRDHAIHLLMPESTPVLSRLFQASVFNYGKFFRDFCQTSFLPESSLGVLALVGNQTPPTAVHLTSKYGPDVGREILEMCQQIEREVELFDDFRYAIPVDYRLVLSNSDAVGEIVLANAVDSGLEGLVVTKPVDHEKTHPYLTMEAVTMIDRRLSDRLAQKEKLGRLGKSSAAPDQFSSYDFYAVVQYEGWRSSPRGPYHHYTSRPKVHRYSDEAIEYVVEKICTHPEYLRIARNRYRNQTRRSTGTTVE